jgi:hypothetical protein
VSVGYSGRPLAAKLGIKEGSRVALVGAPSGFESLLAPLPPSVRMSRRLGNDGAHDLVLAFVKERAALERAWDRLTASLTPSGMLWVAWPKRASKVPTDVTEDVVRAVCLPRGWVDTKVCAVDEVWSGLRLVLRLANRPAARR